MKQKGILSNQETTNNVYQILIDIPTLKISEDRYNKIIELIYKEVDIHKYMISLNYISEDQQKLLENILKHIPDLFNGKLGNLKIPPIKFDLKPGAKPYHTCAFPILKAYENLTKEEYQRFKELDIWEHTYDYKWAARIFTIPKKTGDVRVVTDF